MLNLILSQAPPTDFYNLYKLFSSIINSPATAALISVILGINSYSRGYRQVASLMRRKRLVWFWPTFVTRYALNWGVLLHAAIVWTCLFLVASVGAIYISPSLSLHSAPGIVFVMFGVVSTLAGLFNTIALLNQRLGYVTSFELLFYRMDEVVREVVTRNPARITRDLSREELVYLLDYTPRIGEISASPEVSEQTYKLLERLRSTPACECHFVFLASEAFVDMSTQPEADLEQFYKRILGRQTIGDKKEWSAKVKELVSRAEESMHHLDGDNVAIWRSRRIHSEHYFVARDSAVAYYVKPELNGDRNDLKGEKTDDLAQVEYLRDVVKDYICDAVTPRVAKCGQCGIVLCFGVGQTRVSRIEVFFAKEQSVVSEKNILSGLRKGLAACDRQIIEVNGRLEAGSRCRYSLPLPPEGCDWLRVRLIKQSEAGQGLGSPFSYTLSLKMADDWSHRE